MTETEIEQAPTKGWDFLAEGAAQDRAAKEQAEGKTTAPQPTPNAPEKTTTLQQASEDRFANYNGPKSGDWKLVNKERDDYKAKVAEMEKARAEAEAKWQKELEDARKSPAVSGKELEDARAEAARWKAQYSEVALETLPEFTTKYQARFDEATAGLKAMLGAKSDDVLAALHLPDGQHKAEILEKLTEGLNEFQKGEIFGTNRELRKINTERNSELKQANEKLGKIAQERAAKAQERQQSIEKEFQQTLERMQDAKEGVPGFILRSGTTPEDVAYNAKVKERVQVARQIFTGQLDAGSMARQAAMAANAPHLIEQNKALLAELAARDATIQQLQGSGPGMGGSGGGKDAKAGPKNWSEMFADSGPSANTP